MKKRIEATIKKQRGRHQTGEIISTSSSLDRISKLDNIDAIFVDCALFLSSNQKEKIYETYKEETKNDNYEWVEFDFSKEETLNNTIYRTIQRLK